MMMNAQNAQMNGGNKMMNFGKACMAEPGRRQKVTLKDVAGTEGREGRPAGDR